MHIYTYGNVGRGGMVVPTLREGLAPDRVPLAYPLPRPFVGGRGGNVRSTLRRVLDGSRTRLAPRRFALP